MTEDILQPHNCHGDVVLDSINKYSGGSGKGAVEEGEGADVLTGGVLRTMRQNPANHKEIDNRKQNAVVDEKENV